MTLGHAQSHPTVTPPLATQSPSGADSPPTAPSERNWPTVSQLAEWRRDDVYLSEGWLKVPIGGSTFLYGDGGVGKSFLAYQFGVCVAAGMPFMGGDTVRGRVLLIEAEASGPEAAHRVQSAARALGIDMDVVDRRFRIFPIQHRGQTAFELAGELKQLVEEFDPDLIVFDSLTSVFGGDPTDATHVGQVFRLLNSLIGSRRAALVLHHVSTTGLQTNKKSPEMGGLRSIRNLARMVYRLGAVDHNGCQQIDMTKSNFRWTGSKAQTVVRGEVDGALIFQPSVRISLGGANAKRSWTLDDVANGDAVLEVLERRGEINLGALHKELAALTGKGVSSVRDQLKGHDVLHGLERDSKIALRRDPEDGRRTLVRVSDNSHAE